MEALIKKQLKTEKEKHDITGLDNKFSNRHNPPPIDISIAFFFGK
jgi:hypothetical protein